MPPELLLASASPRRRVLLERCGLAFEIQPADVDERALSGEKPLEQAVRLARSKALTVARTCAAAPPRVVLGADTIVVLGDRVFGKPAHTEEAVSHLLTLTGQTHRVITAVALVRSNSLDAREVAVESQVRLRPAGEAEIRQYVATGEPLDKAGAYALQGEGRRFVESVLGSESNVIGLPLEETLALLAAEGIRPAPRA